MTIRFACPVSFGLLALAANLAGAAQVDDATAVRMAAPHELIVAVDVTPAQREAILTPIDNLYGFWNNGSADLLKKALPPGRPQGQAGPAAASKGFLAAVPDRVVTVVQQLAPGGRPRLRAAGRAAAEVNSHSRGFQPSSTTE